MRLKSNPSAQGEQHGTSIQTRFEPRQRSLQRRSVDFRRGSTAWHGFLRRHRESHARKEQAHPCRTRQNGAGDAAGGGDALHRAGLPCAPVLQRQADQPSVCRREVEEEHLAGGSAGHRPVHPDADQGEHPPVRQGRGPGDSLQGRDRTVGKRLARGGDQEAR